LHRIALALVAALLGLPPAATSHSAKSGDPKLMVLRLNDLPTGFERTKGRYVSNVQTAKESVGTTLADYVRWGRITGYQVEFTRSAIVGLIQVTSSASTYRTSLGAGKSQRDSYQRAANELKFHRLSLGPTIGNESRFYSYKVTKSGFKVIVYAVLWRWKTVKATLFAGGIEGTVPPEVAVALARKQQTRIRAQVP
jgi:hypothetical protein